MEPFFWPISSNLVEVIRFLFCNIQLTQREEMDRDKRGFKKKRCNSFQHLIFQRRQKSKRFKIYDNIDKDVEVSNI